MFICEDATRNLTRCVNYPAGIINITDVAFPEFPEENEYVCGNNQVNVNSTSKCSASEDDARKLTSILGNICNGKRFCKVHLAHGIYKGMHLPCRDLNMRIRIGVFYECIYCKCICIVSLCIVYAFKLTQRWHKIMISTTLQVGSDRSTKDQKIVRCQKLETGFYKTEKIYPVNLWIPSCFITFTLFSYA